MATQYPSPIGPTQSGAPLGPTPPVDPLMQMLMSLLAPQPQQQQSGGDLSGLLAQLRNDPVGDQNRSYAAGVSGPANPFTNGFFQNSAAQMTPEARLASQGNNAMNQWAQLGAVQGVDPTQLASLNQATRQAPEMPMQDNGMAALLASGAPPVQPGFNMGARQGAEQALMQQMMPQFPQPSLPKGPKAKRPLGSPKPGFNFRA